MIKYIFPFTYGFATRAQTAANKLSFAAIFLLPILFICALSGMTADSFILRFALGMISLYSIYEIGYLQNDVYTTKHEKNPTYRLDKCKRIEIERHAPLFILVRIMIFLLCYALILIQSREHTTEFLFAFIMLISIFMVHNLIRSRLNILTYLVLVSLKYATLPVLFLPAEALPVAFGSLFFAFALPRSIEHAAKPKYEVTLLRELHADTFRVVYYGILSTFFVCLWLKEKQFMPPAILSLWFFAYRSILFCALHLKEDWMQQYREKRKEPIR